MFIFLFLGVLCRCWCRFVLTAQLRIPVWHGYKRRNRMLLWTMTSWFRQRWYHFEFVSVLLVEFWTTGDFTWWARWCVGGANDVGEVIIVPMLHVMDRIRCLSRVVPFSFLICSLPLHNWWMPIGYTRCAAIFAQVTFRYRLTHRSRRNGCANPLSLYLLILTINICASYILFHLGNLPIDGVHVARGYLVTTWLQILRCPTLLWWNIRTLYAHC